MMCANNCPYSAAEGEMGVVEYGQLFADDIYV